MKPVKQEELQQALNRYEATFSSRRNLIEKKQHLIAGYPQYQERFIVNIGKQMKLIPTKEIAYFYTENKVVYMVTDTADKYTVDFTLEQLVKILNPKFFFRINRQFVINISAIVRMIPASKSRLKLSLKPGAKYEAVTSFERTAKFRKWLMGLL
jgi:DNA-binding LytR/AlgR family response regulator